jgi:hypothetical protein
VSPERARALRASAAAYGRSTPELLARYDRATSSWRTSQLCLDGALSEFSETWPRSGLMRNGTAYQLPPLVRLTDETGCGLLPTPKVSDQAAVRGAEWTGTNWQRAGTNWGANLADVVMWPTPDTVNRKSAKAMTASTDNGRRSGGGNSSPPGLEQAVELSLGIIPRELQGVEQLPPKTQEMWPTPQAEMASGPGHSGVLRDRLDYAVIRGATKHKLYSEPTIGGQLNPTWVEWLMGFPLNWTSLED